MGASIAPRFDEHGEAFGDFVGLERPVEPGDLDPGDPPRDLEEERPEDAPPVEMAPSAGGVGGALNQVIGLSDEPLFARFVLLSPSAALSAAWRRSSARWLLMSCSACLTSYVETLEKTVGPRGEA